MFSWSVSGSPMRPASRRRIIPAFAGGFVLAASFILSPPVMFLYEPTTELYPRGRNEVWEAVRALVAALTTVLLTTQYLEEAYQLADHICVIDASLSIAECTPESLKSFVAAIASTSSCVAPAR